MTKKLPEAAAARPATPKIGTIAWIEATIVASLGWMGSGTFQRLADAIPAKRRHLGYALARLMKAGTIVAKGTVEVSTRSGVKAIPLYGLAEGGTGQAAPGQAPPQPAARPEAARHAPAQAPASTADRAAGSTAKPRSRGRPKGFVSGGWNAQACEETTRALREHGPQGTDDLSYRLGGVPRQWLGRPLRRLEESGAIVAREGCRAHRDGGPEPFVLWMLAPSPSGDRPMNGQVVADLRVLDVDQCAACSPRSETRP